MTTVLTIGLSNAAVATLFAILAYLVGRRTHRPGLAHTLWLFVFIKLITPPILEFPIAQWEQTARPAPEYRWEWTKRDIPIRRLLPINKPDWEQVLESDSPQSVLKRRIDPQTGLPLPPEKERKPALPQSRLLNVPTETIEIEEQYEAVLRVEHPVLSKPFPWLELVLGVWAIGTLLWLLCAWIRIMGFQRLLNHARAPDAESLALFQNLAARIGMKRVPRFRLLPGPLSPMVWSFGRPTIYFPIDLWNSLTVHQRESLLAHELFHMKRGDHWIRWLELLVTACYWWLPTVWWGRRELHRVEEECCDAQVLHSLPGSKRIYASALLDALDFLAEGRRTLPAVASSISPATCIRRRLLLILSGDSYLRISLSLKVLLLVGISSVLMFTPTVVPAVSIETEGKPPSKPESPWIRDPFTFEAPYRLSSDLFDGLPLAVAYAPDNSRIAVAGDNQQIEIWDVRTRQRLHILQGHQDVVSALVFSPDGHWLASASHDRTVRLWDVQSGQELRSFQGHRKWVHCLAFSPDGKSLASGGYDKLIRIWNPETGDVRAEFRGHGGAVRALAFSPDGQWIVSGGSDHSVRVWSCQEDRPPLLLKGHLSAVRSVAISPNGQWIVSGGEDRTVRIWHTKDHSLYRVLEGLEDQVSALAFTPKSTSLLVATWNGIVTQWDTSNWIQRDFHRGHTEPITGLSMRTDGRGFVTCGYDRSVQIWPATPNPPKPMARFNGHRATITGMAISKKTKQLATSSLDGTVRLWNSDTAEELRTFRTDGPGVVCMDLSQDGSRLVACDETRRLRIWHTDSGQLLQNLESPNNLSKLVFSPNGRVLAGCTSNGEVCIWDLLSGRLAQRLSATDGQIKQMLFTTDGTRLITSVDLGSVICWHLPSRQILWIATAAQSQPMQITDLQWSAGGHSLVTVHTTRTIDSNPPVDTHSSIHVWDADTGKEIGSNPLSRPITKRTLQSALLLNKGRFLSAGNDGRIYPYALYAPNEIQAYPAHTSTIRLLLLHPDENSFFSLAEDGEVRRWNVDPK